MATIQEESNSGLCSFGSALGTEVSKSCISQIKKPQAIWLISPSEKFDKTAEFNSEKDRLIKAGKLVILRGVNTFEMTGDDTTETLSDGTEFVTNEAKLKGTATFTNGMYFHKALHSIKGFKNWNVILAPKDGTWSAHNTNLDLIGYTTGMIQPTVLSVGTDSSVQKEGIMFQFIEPDQFNSDWVFRKDATQYKQKGVTQIELSAVNAPSDTDTTVTVKAVYAQNQSEVITGLVFGQFLQKIDGATENPTAGDDSATSGTYPLTVSALSSGEVGELSLYDNSGNNPVVVGADGDYYRSNTLSYTVL